MGRTLRPSAVLFSVWLCAAAMVAVWALQATALDWRVGVAVGGLLAALAAGLKDANTRPDGQLLWDGSAWHWVGPGDAVRMADARVEALLDLQGVLLLRIDKPHHRTAWLWLERRHQPARWLDLRRAVYARSDNARTATVLHDSTFPGLG